MHAVDAKESAHLDAPPGVSGSFLKFLTCPQCADGCASLANDSGQLRCTRCETSFPVIHCSGAVAPWLFADPTSAFSEWRDRNDSLKMRLKVRTAALTEQLAQPGASALTRRRVNHLVDAHRQYAAQVAKQLAPFDLDHRGVANENRARLSRKQTVTSYVNNVFRDWAWQTGEVQGNHELVMQLLEQVGLVELGDMVTLGSGPGALTYLLERALPASASIKFDINPLFAAIDSAMLAGKEVELYEFPMAPLDIASSAVLRSCRAPHASVQEVMGEHPSTRGFVLGDMHQLPFAHEVFDTVLTPWLIDILPGSLAHWMQVINNLLPVGGTWLNTGTCNFDTDSPGAGFTPEEVLELACAAGFEVRAYNFADLAYLQSPASAHRRTERVFSFCAVKTASSGRVRTQPSVGREHQIPVPLNESVEHASSLHLLRAQILGAVDGKRSPADIAEAIARKYDLDPKRATEVVVGVLADI